MKAILMTLATLCLINQAEGVTLSRKFKIGEEWIDFDEEAEYKEAEKKEGPTLDKL